MDQEVEEWQCSLLNRKEREKNSGQKKKKQRGERKKEIRKNRRKEEEAAAVDPEKINSEFSVHNCLLLRLSRRTLQSLRLLLM